MPSDDLAFDPYSPVVAGGGPDPIVTKIGEGNPLRRADLEMAKSAIEKAPSRLDIPPRVRRGLPPTSEEIRKIVREELARVLRP